MKLLVSVSAPVWLPDRLANVVHDMRSAEKRIELFRLIRNAPGSRPVQLGGHEWLQLTDNEFRNWAVREGPHQEAAALLIYRRGSAGPVKAVFEIASWNSKPQAGSVRRALLDLMQDRGLVVSDEELTSAGQSMWIKLAQQAERMSGAAWLMRSPFYLNPARISAEELARAGSEVWGNKQVRIGISLKESL